MHIKISFLLKIACLIVVLLAGCVSYTNNLTTKDRLIGANAYLYGRFKMNKNRTIFNNNAPVMGFRFSCSNGKSYIIGFLPDDPVVAISVEPAACIYVETVFSTADGKDRGSKPVAEGLRKSMQLSAGHAYYLGDFFASMSSAPDLSRGVGAITIRWSIDSFSDNFEDTTKDARYVLPQLTQFPAERQILVGVDAWKD